ncbi:unnamed protein product, partial [Polarella glacialis]
AHSAPSSPTARLSASALLAMGNGNDGMGSSPHGSSPSSPSRTPKASSPMASPMSQVAVTRPTRTTMWSEELGSRRRQAVVEGQKEEKGRQFGVTTLEGYRRMLANRFGSTVAAWRVAIDPTGAGHLAYIAFCMAVDEIGGFTGGVRQLWTEVDARSTNHPTFQDFDPEAYALLEALRKALLAKFPSIRGFWQALDETREHKVEEAGFTARCLVMELEGLPERKLQRLAKLLLPSPVTGRKQLIEDDFQALLLTLPASERQAAWCGDEGTQAAGHSTRGVAAEESKDNLGSTSSSLASTRRVFTNEMPNLNVEDFRKILRRTFGSVYAGWVKYLDVTEVGRVPMGEFVNRARAIGAGGNVSALYASIDVKGRGFITLQDLDAEVSQAVSAFMQKAQAKYGSVPKAWQMAFNGPLKRGVVGHEEFAAGCADIGYEGDVQKLFVLMRPDPGRPFMDHRDLGRHAALSVKERAETL